MRVGLNIEVVVDSVFFVYIDFGGKVRVVFRVFCDVEWILIIV